MAEPIEIMCDLETLGRRAGCVVLSIGCVVFNQDGLRQEFYTALPIEPQKQIGLHVDPDTEKWWKQQSSSARDVFSECDNAGSLVFELDKFEKWLKTLGGVNSRCLWGCGSEFDNAILIGLYAALDRPLPWAYWNSRCYRTLKNLPQAKAAVPMAERKGTYHNALSDAKNQAEHAIALMKWLQVWP